MSHEMHMHLKMTKQVFGNRGFLTGEFSQPCTLVKSTTSQYPHLEPKNEKIETIFFASRLIYQKFDTSDTVH